VCKRRRKKISPLLICGVRHNHKEVMETMISLIKSKGHYHSIQQVLLPFEKDIKKAFSKINRIVIKINLVVTQTPRRPKGVNIAVTPVESVRGFIDFISPFFQNKIIIVEQSCWGNTKVGFSMYGYEELANKYDNVELLDMADDGVVRKRVDYSQEELLLPFNKTMIEAPFLVSIARPKVHCNTAMTAGIKNVVIGAVEGYKNRKGLHTKKDLHKVIAKIAKIILPHLVIIDGVVGMEESGPIQGKEINSGWTLASFDALAADSLTAYLMDFEIKGIPYLCMIHNLGLGKLYTKDKIEVIGEKPDDLVTHFKPYRKFAKDLKKQSSK
jgi:uncharacterized protein (DUF362 family)